MDAEKKKEEVAIEEEQVATQNQEPEILKPTISSEELILDRKPNSNIELAKRVEQYNYKQGYKTVRGNGGIKIYDDKKEEVETKQVYIKPPKKKMNPLTLLIPLLLLVLLGGTLYLYTSGFFDKKPSSEVSEKEEEKEEVVELKNINYKCSLKKVYEESKYNSIQEIKFFTVNNKLKKKEEYTTLQYFEERPSNIVTNCPLYAEKYEGFDGFVKQCYMEDDLSVTYKTSIDLEVLKEKELVFEREYEEKIIIEDELDEDIFELLENLKEKEFTCEQFE